MLAKLAIICTFAFAAPAIAENCAKRDLIVQRLGAQYSEQLTAGGLQTDETTQSVVEVWASPETGTFTVMMTNPNGISCIMATGTDWFHQGKNVNLGGKLS